MDTVLKSKPNYIVHPHKFILWLFLVTIIMIFGGLTSAYIVQMSFLKPEERILFQLPNILWNNLGIVLLSSVSVQYASWAVRKGETQRALLALGITLLLAIAFLVGQFFAMKEMTLTANLPFVDSGRKDNLVSYFYIFVGLHAFHLLAGIVMIITTLTLTVKNRFKPGGKSRTYEITMVFWHFLTILWVYLFLFLMYTQQ